MYIFIDPMSSGTRLKMNYCLLDKKVCYIKIYCQLHRKVLREYHIYMMCIMHVIYSNNRLPTEWKTENGFDPKYFRCIQIESHNYNAN